MIVRVKEHAVGCQHREPVDHTIGQIASLAGRKGIRQLILVKIDRHGHRTEKVPRESKKGRKVEHVGCQDQIGAKPKSSCALGKCQGPSLHTPLPEPRLKRQQLDLMTAMGRVTSGPGLVATSAVWFKQQYLHAYSANGCIRRWGQQKAFLASLCCQPAGRSPPTRDTSRSL
jgi:hypothetical protein